jgi:hypothetical protein
MRLTEVSAGKEKTTKKSRWSESQTRKGQLNVDRVINKLMGRVLPLWAALAAILMAGGAAAPAQAQLLGQQLFPSDYPWNQNISNAPVAPNSAAIIAHIGAATRVTPNWYSDNPADGAVPLYGIPFNVVHGNSTAKVTVIVDNFPSESDLVAVPIPSNAVLEGDYANGPNPNGAGYGPDNPNQRGDSHLIVWDEDNNIAYELFGASRPTDPTLFPNNSDVELPHTDGMWHAAQETVWYMTLDMFRTLGETSADGAGLSVLAGLARPDEGLPVSQGGQGAINHALGVTLPGGDINPQYIYPASHMLPTSSSSPDNVPLGTRLRLKNTPAINALINTMGPESQSLARAMQQYGLIVADIGSAMFVTGAPASVDTNNQISLTWDVTDIFASNGLEALNAGDFDVVDLTPIVTGLSFSSGPAGSTLFVNGQNFSGAAGKVSVLFGGTPASSVTVLGDTQISVTVPSGTGTVDVRVQSGINETDNLSNTPNANVNAPIFGYGTSAVTTADEFTYVVPAPTTILDERLLFGSLSYSLLSLNRDAPWKVSGIQFTFSNPIVTGQAGNLQVTDSFGNPVPATGLTGVGTNTLTFPLPLYNGRFTANLSGLVDSNNQTVPGVTLQFQVLTGDANGDGVVTISDAVLVNNARSPYNVFADVNGDGVVNVTDVNLVRANLGKKLP